MADPLFKFGHVPDSENSAPFEYPNCWAHERTIRVNRLVIAPRGHHVSLMIDLLESMKEPYGLLYVLVVPRTEQCGGRYQSPESVSRESAKTFLLQFQNFLEQDGRHHLWVGAVDKSSLLVYDRHNVLYAYGPLPAFEETLRAKGLREAQQIRFPSPHSHHYHDSFDVELDALIKHLAWKQSPLVDGDEL